MRASRAQISQEHLRVCKRLSVQKVEIRFVETATSGVLFQAGAQRVVCACLQHIYKGCSTSTCRNKGLRSGFTCSSSGFERIQRREKAESGVVPMRTGRADPVCYWM